MDCSIGPASTTVTLILKYAVTNAAYPWSRRQAQKLLEACNRPHTRSRHRQQSAWPPSQCLHDEKYHDKYLQHLSWCTQSAKILCHVRQCIKCDQQFIVMAGKSLRPHCICNAYSFQLKSTSSHHRLHGTPTGLTLNLNGRRMMYDRLG